MRFFVFRAPRVTGTADGDTVHLAIRDRMQAAPGYRPAAVAADVPESPA